MVNIGIYRFGAAIRSINQGGCKQWAKSNSSNVALLPAVANSEAVTFMKPEDY
jgi:hypothetical protein